MSRIFHRSLHRDLPVAVGGEGIFLIDKAGKRYLDACCGAAVSCLGHNNPVIVEATKAQLDQLPYAHTGFFTTDVAEELAEFLIAKSGGAFAKTYFLSGGSEAIETAMKMARQYFVEIGEPEREFFISRRQSYHGNTISALSVGGNMWRRQVYEPILSRASHIAPCFAYRNQRAHESSEEYGLRVANELEEQILSLGDKKVIAFIAETVVGATSGAVTAVPGYFKRVREICDQYGVLLILDEIMSGMGRTGKRYAFDDEGIQPDLACIAKGLGGGYQAISAALVSKKVFDAIHQGSGSFQHGHTYIGHPTAAAASLAVQHYIDQHHLLNNVMTRSDQLFRELRAEFVDHPFVGDIRGRGLFIGMELVENRETKLPFDPSTKLDLLIKSAGMDNGIMLYPNAGTIDGHSGHHILLAPPFICSESEISDIVARLVQTLNAVFKQLKPGV
ncbi:MAG: aspartate aminotransferase family protein [Acidiferrobacterales bacterium]|nr:aspartate aminotransferase family protein [Acidiferrobacterales bacterium]